MNALMEWMVFLGLSAVAVGMAASMLVTMSMYRAGLALMSSFVGLAGLFVLLDADLLAAIQVMMNVGGMLVMILFMVMLMMDPGGEMMWDMKRKMHLPGPGALSMRMPREPVPAAPEAADSHAAPRPTEWTCPMHPEVRSDQPGNCPKCGTALVPRGAHDSRAAAGKTYTCPMHPEVRQGAPGTCPKCGMELVPAHDEPSKGHAHQMGRREHYRMMVDMAMSTAQLPWAVALGVASAVMLIWLVVRTPWPLSSARPAVDATSAVGELLLSRYMIAFEGAAFLILAGIVGAVIFGTRDSAPPRLTRK